MLTIEVIGQVRISNEMPMLGAAGKYLIGYHRIRSLNHVFREWRLLKREIRTEVTKRHVGV